MTEQPEGSVQGTIAPGQGAEGETTGGDLQHLSLDQLKALRRQATAPAPVASGTTAPASPPGPRLDTMNLEELKAFRQQVATSDAGSPPGQPPPPAPAPSPSLEEQKQALAETYGGTPGFFKRTVLGGVTQGLINLAGAPADLLNLPGAALNSVTSYLTMAPQMLGQTPGETSSQLQQGLPQMPGGSADINRVVRQQLASRGINPEDLLDPQGGVERFVQAVVREGTGAVVPVGIVGGVAKLAALPARSIPAIARTINLAETAGARGGISVLDAIAQADLSQIAAWQALYGGLAGAGGETAVAAFGDNPYARALGQLFGGLSPEAVKIVAGLGSKLPKLFQQFSKDPEAFQRAVNAMVMEELQKTRATVEPRLDAAVRVQGQTGETPFTLGQATGNPTLQRTEPLVAGRSPDAATQLATVRQNQQTQLATQAEQRVNAATQGAGMENVSPLLQQQRQAELDAMALRESQATSALTQAREGMLGDAQAQTTAARERVTEETRRAQEVSQKAADRARQAEGRVVPVEQQLVGERQTVLARATERTQTAQDQFVDAQMQASILQNQMQAKVAQAEADAAAEVQRLRQAGVPSEAIDYQSGQVVRTAVQKQLSTNQAAASRLYQAVDPFDQTRGPLESLYPDLAGIATAAQEAGQPVPDAVRRVLKAMEVRARRYQEEGIEALATARQPGPLPQAPMTARELRNLPDTDVELQTFIRRKKGINSAEAELLSELRALTSPKETGTTGLLNRNGLSLQHMAEEAQQAGFIKHPETTELLTALDESLRTGKKYSDANSRLDSILGEPLGGPTLDPGFFLSGDPAAQMAATPITFMELHRLKSQLLAAQREASDPTLRRTLKNVVDTVERKMEILAEDSGDVGLFTRYRAAQDLYKRTVVPFYGPGPGAEVLARTNGVYRVPNENVVARFWHSAGQGAHSDAAAFNRLIGTDQEARAALETYAANELYLTAAPTGRLDLKAAERWRLAHETQLAMYPEIAARFRTVADLEQRVKDVQAAAVELRLGQEALVAPLSQAATTAERSEQAVQAAIQPGARPVVPEGGRAFTPQQAAASEAQQQLAPYAATVTEAQRQASQARQIATDAERGGQQFVRAAEQEATQAERQQQAIQTAVQPGARRVVPEGGQAFTPAQTAASQAQQRLAPLQADLAAIQAENAARRKAIDLHITSQLMGEDAPQRLEQILGRKGLDRQRALMEVVDVVQSDPQAQRGFLHGLWDAYKARATKPVSGLPGLDIPFQDPTQLRAFLTEYKDVLTRLAGPQFVDDLNVIAMGVEMAGSRVQGGADLTKTLTATSRMQRTTQRMLPLIGLGGGGLWGYAIGQGMREWLAGSQGIRAQLVNAAFAEALFNPDLAATLALLRKPGATPAQVAPRLYIHGFYLGLGQGRPGEQDRTPSAGP